ncbi:MAG: ATPase, T2SS/T4P/T4SS family [Mobilitalea sp.]
MEKTDRRKKRLGDLLVDAKVITEEQLTNALVQQKKTSDRKLGEVILDLGYTNELQIAFALKEQLNYDIIQLSAIKIPEDILALINDKSLLRKYVIIPFSFHDNNPNILRVAMADPMDIAAIDDVSILTNLRIEPVIATPSDVLAAIDKYYGSAEAQDIATQYSQEIQQQYQRGEDLNLAYNADINSSPIVILVRSIIEQGVRQRASDVHIEPYENRVRVRYRVDGVLFEAMTYQIELLSAIVSRIKIIGEMDISEKRKPQDGRITIMVDRREYDIRVSILPTVFGEKIVMRLADKKALNKSKADLGLNVEELEKFDKLLTHPHGMLLVTGPTGSGKSTTLYTALSELNNNEVNIITVEDPVEANIDGINQVQVNVKADMTFANVLRSILRQDPDIIMIGEIRDSETAAIAVKASITGHLVVSTLHTNSAASTITRLVDMGVEPYLLADATVGVIAQRLVRRLCKCKHARPAETIEKSLLGANLYEEIELYDPTGCNLCNGTGYRGRIGIYEIMPISPKLKDIISSQGTAADIQEAALAEGMKTLQDSAADYVLQGITSIAEMKRVTIED